MKYGLGLPNRGILFGSTTIKELLALTELADENPLFESVWIGDSLFAKPRLEAVGLLGGMATRTSRVRLGVGCMASFPLRDPVLFAYQWASLDQLSEGRMLLAACTGLVGPSYAEEATTFGATDQQRVKRLIENIEILRRLWREDDVTFHGEFRAFEHVTIEPKPVQQPCPIWIASNPHGGPPGSEAARRSDLALRRVVRRADGWMSADMPKGITAARWQKVQAFCRELDRDPAPLAPYLYHNININEDREAAYAESKRFIECYYGAGFPMAFVDAWTIYGSPAECIEGIHRLQSYGVEGITLRLTTWSQRAQYDRLVNEVLPHVGL